MPPLTATLPPGGRQTRPGRTIRDRSISDAITGPERWYPSRRTDPWSGSTTSRRSTSSSCGPRRARGTSGRPARRRDPAASTPGSPGPTARCSPGTAREHQGGDEPDEKVQRDERQRRFVADAGLLGLGGAEEAETARAATTTRAASGLVLGVLGDAVSVVVMGPPCCCLRRRMHSVLEEVASAGLSDGLYAADLRFCECPRQDSNLRPCLRRAFWRALPER